MTVRSFAWPRKDRIAICWNDQKKKKKKWKWEQNFWLEYIIQSSILNSSWIWNPKQQSVLYIYLKHIK